VASAGLYASLHLAPDRQPHQHSITVFLQAGCPSCRPTNSVKAPKAQVVAVIQPKTKMRNIANPNIFDSATFFFLNFATKFS